jgi:molybdopterin/thiamine biosynthesis adenylyltransferase
LAANGRYPRNELLFGAEGQRRIKGARVGIVGLGGLGSQVAQQLGYLGVLDFVLVDSDTVTESSLNRLIGAGADDVGTAKIAVADRMLTTIQPDVRVITKETMLPDVPAQDALSDTAYIFGCLDEDSPRLTLTELATSLGITYLDLASDVLPDGEYGGRIVVAKGNGCLYCLGEIDQEALRRASLSEDQRRAHDAIYGIDRDDLDEAGPSVVSLNGVVASLAVNEFMLDVTALDKPARFILYYGKQRRIRKRTTEPEPGCPYCGRWPRDNETQAPDLT